MSYTPVEGLTLRGSWARSFKAPTLFQRFIPYQTILLPAAVFGAGTGSDTVFFTSGGNPDVTSERARSWTAGVELQPVAIPELTFSATWYDIRYQDRVVRPIAGSIAAAFRDPGFANLIDFSPDPTTLSELIAGSLFGLENFSGSPYDPANVAAFVDNRTLKAAIEGMLKAGKVVAAGCHGPIALAQCAKPDGTPLVAGLEVTGFSDVEEGQVGQTGNVPFLIESKFKELGASYVCGEPWTSKTAAAGKLLTGQNPQSSEALAALVAAEPSEQAKSCLLYTSPSPRDRTSSRMPSSA